MSNRQLRNQRRAAARQARKLEQKSVASSPASAMQIPEPGDGSIQPALPQASNRAEINRANSQHSTGPRTPQGKARSSENSFKHGLYSKQLVLPSEDPAELDQLRASLRAEHQPANTTEDILVNEIADNFWRIRRMRQLEARTLAPENLNDLDNLLPMLQLIQRTLASAERAFHKSLAALRQLQKDRGFVPQNDMPDTGFVPQISADDPPGLPLPTGFVSQNSPHPLAEAA